MATGDDEVNCIANQQEYIYWCNQCGKQRLGSTDIFSEDFYCNSCWIAFELTQKHSSNLPSTKNNKKQKHSPNWEENDNDIPEWVLPTVLTDFKFDTCINKTEDRENIASPTVTMSYNDYGKRKQKQRQKSSNIPPKKSQNTDSETVEYYENVPVLMPLTIPSLQSAISKLLSYNPWYLGIDCEWKPNFFKHKKENKVSLLQIAHEHMIILVRLNKFKNNVYQTLSRTGLLSVLSNKNIIKCGVNIKGDKLKLFNDYEINMVSCLELTQFYLYSTDSQQNIGYSLGLARLCKEVLGYEMKYKSKKITMSNWETNVLSKKQILYAAQDAYLGYSIFDELFHNWNSIDGSIHSLLRDVDDFMAKRKKFHRKQKKKKGRKRSAFAN